MSTYDKDKTIIFNYESHVRELNDRFSRLIKQLGQNNKKDWHTKVASMRYEFEVDFAYALRELNGCPPYLQGKMFDQASSIVNALVAHLKQKKTPEDATVVE